jgi:AcrR family transcriptional regulator
MARGRLRHAAAEPARSRGPGGSSTTRERILDVALDLFVRKGYTETSLREIASELGFTKAALYYHFESKQDILLALHMRVHQLTEELLPLLEVEASSDAMWERLLDGLIGLALEHRRLIELHIRNQEAIADLHRGTGLKLHGPPGPDIERHLQTLLTDPSLPLERRVRRMASLGVIAGVLLAAGSFADTDDAELEAAMRTVVHEVLGGGAS